MQVKIPGYQFIIMLLTFKLYRWLIAIRSGGFYPWNFMGLWAATLPSPTAYYPLDGDALDHTGNDNNGANFGATFFTPAYVRLEAIQFNGVGSYPPRSVLWPLYATRRHPTTVIEFQSSDSIRLLRLRDCRRVAQAEPVQTQETGRTR
jgi:hypothetical protein